MLYYSSMATYGDRELELNMTGDDVQELQIKLGGWFGAYPAEKPRWDGVFDTATENAVIRFQLAHNLPDTGVVDHWTFTRLDQEAADHFFSLAQYMCPTKTNGCKGFGTNRNSFTHVSDSGSTSTILIPGGEAAGVSKVLIWMLRGLLARAESSYYNVPGGGYRCAYDNEAKNRTTTNHIGNAIDVKPFKDDWSEAPLYEEQTVMGETISVKYTDATRNFRLVCNAAGIPSDIRASDVVYMERDVPLTPAGYYSSTWVHLDVRTALDGIGGHPADWYATTYTELNAPLYQGQLLIFASAEPPPAPPAPPLYGSQAEEFVAAAAASTLEEWNVYMASEASRLEASTSSLAGDIDPAIVAAAGLPEELVNLAHEVGINGVLAIAYDRADVIEAARRSYILSQHTRDDYRSFSRLTNDKLVSALDASNALFRRRFENYSLPAEDCNA